MGTSLAYSRLFKADRAIEEHISKRPEVAGTTGGSSCEPLKIGIQLYVNEYSVNGRVEAQFAESIGRLLQRCWDAHVLSNLQWGLGNWQFESISIPYTRLNKANYFLSHALT